MAYIVQNVSLADQRIQLGAEELIRGLDFGTNWGKVRIGMRVAVQANSSFTGLDFAVGVCQGNKGYTATDTVDAVGARTGAIANPMSVTWTYNANGYVSHNFVGPFVFRKVGSQIVSSTFGGSYAAYMAAQPNVNTVRTGYYVDITKSAGAITVSTWRPASAIPAQTDCSRYAHLVNMETENAISVAGQGYNTDGLVLSIGGSQAWDSLFVSWSRLMPVIEINDLTVLRYY